MAKTFKPDDVNSPATTSEAHDIMAPRLAKVRTLLGGTEAMRAAGEVFLPRFDNESTPNYQRRLQGAVLYNQTEMTLTSWVGRVFRNEPETDDGALPAPITDLFDDIDLEGTGFNPFCREWFRAGAAFGLGPILVLLPTSDIATTAGRARTRQDDLNEGRRPYWKHLAPENILYARMATRPNGERYVSHLRVLGERVEPQEFVDVIVPQITVYTDRDVGIYELRKVRGGKEKWVRIGDPVAHDMGEVPIVPFYFEKEADFVGSTALTDLADLNIRHWQSTANQISCLDVARFPILAGSGISEEEEVVIGPKKFLRGEAPDSKFYYVEHTGSALMSGASEIESLEAQMSSYGAEFLKKQLSHVTAASRILDQSESTAPIEDAVVRFNDAVSKAFYFTAKWLGIDPPAVGALEFSVELPDVMSEEDPKNPEKKKAKEDPEDKD